MKRLITAVLLLTIVIASTSCRSGYGCRGNQSWGKMTSRINRFN